MMRNANKILIRKSQGKRPLETPRHRWENNINPLKPNGNYVPPVLITNNSAVCIYGFRMILRVNSDYNLK
jgi:hypothetical protein